MRWSQGGSSSAYKKKNRRHQFVIFHLKSFKTKTMKNSLIIWQHFKKTVVALS